MKEFIIQTFLQNCPLEPESCVIAKCKLQTKPSNSVKRSILIVRNMDPSPRVMMNRLHSG